MSISSDGSVSIKISEESVRAMRVEGAWPLLAAVPKRRYVRFILLISLSVS